MIFGAPNEYANFDKYQLGEDKAGKAAPVVRQDEATKKGAVSLNLFPLSDEPMVVCVQFDLPDGAQMLEGGDRDAATTPDLESQAQVVWYRCVTQSRADRLTGRYDVDMLVFPFAELYKQR